MLKLKNIFVIIVENIQQAEKIYFKTGLLDENDKNKIIEITNGDNFTLPVSHYYYKNKKLNYLDLRFVNKFYRYIKDYKNKFFPIKGLNSIKDINEENVLRIYYALNYRHEVIKILNKLPSQAIRNIKEEIKIERDDRQFNDLYLKIENFMVDFTSILKRRVTNKFKDKFIKTIFKSSNDSFEKWFEEINRFDSEFENSQEILNLIRRDKDLKLVAKIDNCLIVKVTSQEAISKLGCNSLWCFSKPNSFTDWNAYSYNGMVYVVIDFDLESYDDQFMVVFTYPIIFNEENEISDEYTSAYNFNNESIEDINEYLVSTIGLNNAKKYINFEI